MCINDGAGYPCIITLETGTRTPCHGGCGAAVAYVMCQVLWQGTQAPDKPFYTGVVFSSFNATTSKEKERSIVKS